MIPVILKGVASDPIATTVPETAETLSITYQGVTRTFANVAAGASVDLAYTAEETAQFALGAFPIVSEATLADGTVRKYPLTAKICVTDCPAEVTSTALAIASGLPSAATAEDSPGDLKTKFNQLLNAVRNAVALGVMALCMAAGAAGVSSAPLDSIPGTANVVTNVDLSGIVADETDPHAPGIVSNIVTKSYVESLGISGGGGGGGSVDLPAYWALANVTNAAGKPVTATDVGAFPAAWDDFYRAWRTDKNIFSDGLLYGQGVYVNDTWSESIYAGLGNPQEVVYGISVNGADALHGNVELTIPETPTAASLGAATTQALNAVSATVSSWTTYWSGDDVRVTVTNYYGTQGMPRVYLEEKVSEGGSNYFKTVWSEMTRWNAFLAPYESFTNAVRAELDQKADRAWGFYDSSTGEYAPDGFTWVSSPSIAIAGDLSYQKTATSDGTVWVLTSRGAVTETSGVISNGYFRISDDEGNSIFEIVKGDKRTVGASASGTRVETVSGVTHMHVVYNVVSDEHPVAYFTAALTDATWYAETDDACPCNVSWTGESGAWQLELWPKSTSPTMFVKATYEVGGNTQIRYGAAVGLTTVVIGGTEYTVGTATIDGHTVLTLTP